MARTADPALKQQLLDEVVDHFAVNGLASMSLRPLAAALGTSPNRLVHHFGTRDELLVAALERLTERMVEIRAGWLATEPGLTAIDVLRRWWRWVLEDPMHLAMTRLTIEAAALEATLPGLPGTVRADQIGVWRGHIESWLVSLGMPRREAATEATIAKAAFTGFAIDLMATGDRRRTTAALDAYLALMEERVAVSVPEAQR